MKDVYYTSEIEDVVGICGEDEYTEEIKLYAINKFLNGSITAVQAGVMNDLLASNARWNKYREVTNNLKHESFFSLRFADEVVNAEKRLNDEINRICGQFKDYPPMMRFYTFLLLANASYTGDIRRPECMLENYYLAGEITKHAAARGHLFDEDYQKLQKRTKELARCDRLMRLVENCY